MEQNKFDKVMNYIDENIHQEIKSLKEGIFKSIGYHSSKFEQCFNIITEENLTDYIHKRKMYFAAQDITLYPT